ncbi:NADH dehydrogenase subunit 4L (mitochondrion) [Eublepharis macularius]|uniref:NADH-ubiquinone oxidoreductase chain 4L n=1 Tax=Eublepharis macularius TaxID=481883 RepID=A0A1L7NTZ1_EUBMA|nr:NADH dehydrogenase subunit 4L [Eublepharis macularius]WEF49958.1 NADH dehydrogenase subunit 4L [Eublepharis macularius]BAW33381.1 NADH dehydrogenase subunit 4L [Eublepharis macularius]
MTLMQFTLLSSFTLSMLGMTMYRTHLISALLCIESMLLTLFLATTTFMQTTQTTTITILPMTLLTFSACEASVGLALLVASTRTYASDHLNTMNLLQC